MPGLTAFDLAFRISPIFLTGGSASSLAGGTLPITSLIQGLNFTDLLSGGGLLDLDSYFAHFRPMPGSSLEKWRVGMYPFANQATAANAVIADPTTISLEMVCPARGEGSYALKQAVMSSLKRALDQHSSSGGTYSVNTPAYLYTDCLLLDLVDMTTGDNPQVQWRYQWNFIRPLITQAQAAGAQNNLMSKISDGTQVTPTAPAGSVSVEDRQISPSGVDATVGNPGSGAAPPVVPSSQPSQGSGFSGTTGSWNSQPPEGGNDTGFSTGAPSSIDSAGGFSATTGFIPF